ncbi:MAG: M48 family metallopeptidase [Sphaerochaetaceae bacterium]|jgi:predicted metal-dependent hydrolase
MKVQYNIVRKKGLKNISLRVNNNKEVVVTASTLTPTKTIENFVQKKQSWIEKRVNYINTLYLPLEDKNSYMLLGKVKTLEVAKGKKALHLKEDKFLLINPTKPTDAVIKKMIDTWYKEYAFNLYRTLVDKWVEKLNLIKELPITIVNFPKRLGSCSIKGELKFSIRSLILPIEIVDYLALHEVAHTLYFNHGQEFKALLSKELPNWKTLQQEMSRYQLLLQSF